jgi:hypothetical protein
LVIILIPLRGEKAIKILIGTDERYSSVLTQVTK